MGGSFPIHRWLLVAAALLLISGSALVGSAEETHRAVEPKPKRVSAPMVWIPAGEFTMGCNARVDSLCFHDEGNRPFRVYLDEFYIDRHEVTVAEYEACIDDGWCIEPDFGGACNWDRSDRRDHPVNCVDWYQARDYCEWAGKRLPTEAEWEKAARGTDGRAYPWGNTGFNGDALVANVADTTAKRIHRAWAVSESYEDGFTQTAPVETFPEGRSPYGVHDMVGNVWEWVADWYGEYYYRGAPRRNPSGPSTGEFRVLRGGSWFNFPHLNRVGYRGWYLPDTQYGYLGIRCAR
jgi:formylglycine-generating enzyme required for sulfatase activity